MFGDTGVAALSVTTPNIKLVMKRTATMPVRARRVTPAAVREWLHRENRVCSLLLGERVENIILFAVAMVCLGLVMSMAVTVQPVVGLLGVAVMACGVTMIRKEGSV